MRYILLVFALLAIFVSGGLFFKKGGKPSFLLAIFIFMIGIEILDFLYGTSRLKFIYPEHFAKYYFLAGFLYGPLLIWHLRFYLEKDFRFKPIHLLHLIPVTITLIYWWDILVLPGLERIAFINENFIHVIMPVNYARALHLTIYGLILIGYLYRKRHLVNPKDKLYMWSITLIYFVSCIVISWFTQFANTWRDFDLYYFVACTIIFIIGFLLYSDPQFLKEIAQKYLKSKLNVKDKKRIKSKIISVIENDEVFKRNDLHLTVFAELIDENKHHISQIFSEEFNESFLEYLNKHRVAFAKTLLTEPENHKYTIEAIGQEAGFNNRVSFSKAFRQFVSLTPSEYRKKYSTRLPKL